MTGAAPGTSTAELSAEVSRQLQALGGGGVVVEGEEPVAGVQVVAHLPPHAGLAGPRPPPAGPEARQHVADVVDCQTGHRVLASIQTWDTR